MDITQSSGMQQSQADSVYRALPVSQTSSPTTGQTVNITATNKDVNYWATPAGAIAALTISLPADGVTQLGQIITYGSSQAVAALTVNVSGGTIFGVIGNLAIGDFYAVQKVSANTWARKL